MSKALETIGQAMSIKSRLLSIRKQEAELKEAEAGPTSLEQSEAHNKLVQSYITNYDNVNETIAKFGNDPALIQAKNNAELQLRGSMTVPLNVAAAGQQAHKQGAGPVAASTVETTNMVLDDAGVADKDVQDRVGRLMVKNGAVANGVKVPEMSVIQQSRNIVSDFYGIKKGDESLDEVSVSPSAELQGKLHRVRREATKMFDEAAARSNLNPDERLTFAMSAALFNTGIIGVGEDSATASEALYITQAVMEGLTRRQNVRMENGLAQMPALNRKYEEAAGAVLYDFMAQMKQDGKVMTYDNLMQSVGENELYRALRTPDGLGEAYQTVKNNIADLNQNYDKLSETQRFGMFVGAFADYASHNVDTGSPIRDQYQLTGLERLRTSVDQGTLRAKFAGLAAPLEELFRDFDSQHNEVVVARNGVIQQMELNGNVTAVAPDGKVMGWKATRDAMTNARMQRVMSDPAVFDLMQDMNKVTVGEDGNYILNVGDVDPLALGTYAEAMNLQGEWTNMTLQQATPTTPAVTMNSFSEEGKVIWSESLKQFTDAIMGDYKLFKDDKRNAITEIGKYHTNGIKFGEIIARSPELTMALLNAEGNPNQIHAVANAAMSMHFQAVDNTVIQGAVRADTEVTQRLLQAVPAEVRNRIQTEISQGDFTTVYNQLPEVAATLEALEEQLLTYLESIGQDIKFARTDEKQRQRFVDPFRPPAQRLSELFGRSAGREPYVIQLQANIRKERQRINTIAGVLDNYNRRIEKQGEVEKLQDTLGLTPPRAWAFITTTDDMVNDFRAIADGKYDQFAGRR